MPFSPSQFAINPMQWIATEDGWLDPALAPPLPERLRIVAQAGFTAVKSDIPAGLSLQDYQQQLGEAGIRPGPGYVSMLWDDDEAKRLPYVDRARRLAASNVELGTPLLFLAMGMSKDAVRVRRPAVGFNKVPERLERVRDYLAQAAEAISAEGGTAALHPHVGTWVETADEARFILDSVDEAVLKFGPDSGHLGWTGINPEKLIAEYAPRVAGLHIKDFRADVAARSRENNMDYRSTVNSGLWMEPGLGDSNLEEILGAAGPEFDGWIVIEVDRGSIAPEPSVQLCGRWVADLLAPSPA